MMKYIKEITLDNEIEINGWDRVGYSPDLNSYLYGIGIPGLDTYWRYYFINDDIYEQLKDGTLENLKGIEWYEDVIKHLLIKPIDENVDNCLHGMPIGILYSASSALADYDISRSFIRDANSGIYNMPIHQGYIFDENRDILYAHVLFNKQHFIVPPRQVCKDISNEWQYLYRNMLKLKRYKCDMINDNNYMFAIPIEDFDGFDKWEMDFVKDIEKTNFDDENLPHISVLDNTEIIRVYYEDKMEWKDWVKSRYNIYGWYIDNTSDFFGEVKTNEGHSLRYLKPDHYPLPALFRDEVFNEYRKDCHFVVYRE